MSLSRLEKDAVAAEEARVTALRARAARALKDEEQLKRKEAEENKAHLRYCFKALEDNIWWYKDRAGLPRGPLQLTGLRACYVQGVVDEHTLVWGQGLTGWYPLTNVIGLTANIKNLETVVVKWVYDKCFLQPRLANVRRQRKDALKLLKQGVVTMTPEQREQLKSEFAALKVDELLAPHPQYAAFFAQKAALVAELEDTSGAAGAPGGSLGVTQSGSSGGGKTQAQGRGGGGKQAVAAACLSLAVPLPQDILAQLEQERPQ